MKSKILTVALFLSCSALYGQEVQPLFPEIVVESEENLGITYGAIGVIANELPRGRAVEASSGILFFH